MNCFKKFLVATLAFAASIYAAERVYLAPFSMVGLNEDFVFDLNYFENFVNFDLTKVD